MPIDANVAKGVGKQATEITGGLLGYAYTSDPGGGERIVTRGPDRAFAGKREVPWAAAYFAGVVMEWAKLTGQEVPGGVAYVVDAYPVYTECKKWENTGREDARESHARHHGQN